MKLPELDHARIAIIGAGPTGLGAAHRLHELGITNFSVFEKESHPGGLASSFVDRAGFTGWWTVDPYCDPDDVLPWTRQSLEFVRGDSAGVGVQFEQLRKEQT